MTEHAPRLITSRDNELFKNLRQLSSFGRSNKASGKAFIEGEHLCQALLHHNIVPSLAVFSQSTWLFVDRSLARAAAKTILLPDALMDSLSSLPSAAKMGFVIEVPESRELKPRSPTIVLDRIQDAGNVGSILRSAAAFGFTQIAAMSGTAQLWSGKVLRAGMGAHFALNLVQGLSPKDLSNLSIPLLVTSSLRGQWLHEAQLPWPCAWVLSHEGQGVCSDIEQQASLCLRIAQPGGQESLNVAAAAAICFHQSATQKNFVL